MKRLNMKNKYSFAEYSNKIKKNIELTKIKELTENYKYLYIENYIFFTGRNNLFNDEELIGEYSIHENIKFNDSLKIVENSFKNKLTENSKFFYQIIFERFGTVNFRLFVCLNDEEIASNFDFDKVDFEDEVEEIINNIYKEEEKSSFNLINKKLNSSCYLEKNIFKYGFSTNSNKESFQDSYLFHQHLYKINKSSENYKPSIKWSTYKSFILDLKNILFWLDLDTLVLRTHTYYRVFGLDIINLIHETKLKLKYTRKLQNRHRYFIGLNLDRYHFLGTKAVEYLDELEKVHRLDNSEKLYTRLETNLNEQVNKLEVDRENNINFINGCILGILTVLGIFGVFSSIFAIIKDTKEINKIINKENYATVWEEIKNTTQIIEETKQENESIFNIFDILQSSSYGGEITLTFFTFLSIFLIFIIIRIYSALK